MKKKVIGKKSPVSVYKKKSEIIYNTTTKVKKSVNIVQSTQYETKAYQTNKENIMANDYSIDSYREYNKCPFDSPTSIDMHFNTSEVFSNMTTTNILQNTYDKPYDITNDKLDAPHNVLKPLNKQVCDTGATDIFDNLTFTPLKPSKTDKLDKGPRIILSVNSESEFDDSLDMKTSNKENETHSIISITSTQPPNKWLTVNHHMEHQLSETPQIKKHPNTSSPKELNSPNFSINTDFSRISELSFMPQRVSTEKKCFPQDILDDIKLNSDTYTKDSPNTPMERLYQGNERPPHYFNREQPKFCRQSLFREYQLQKEASEKNYLNPYDQKVWQNEPRFDGSPPRSIDEPPLQSIPEESTQFSETQVLDRTDKQMNTFTIDRTFDKTHDRSRQTTWSKKSIKAEPELWKIPVSQPKKSLKPKIKHSIGSKISNTTFDGNKTNQNITLNQFGNVYSQSATVDPFSSSTYFYDEEAVDKFEKEFKRWLNCVLTPPADLDSNVEMKVDVGKAWIENRNKEVPLAPTREQVSSMYHNSHRLESLRRSARSLLKSPEIAQVFQKLNAQIDKKLIAIRTDRNLHLDVGLQRVIMELLLSYNPLWLRIGLEAIYGLVLPLKSNSDIDGLTTFIIQRMFKNPFLKNKHSKSSAPNMLLPAYMEAIKKFTLKKFFMLVFFLDQAKQRKIISHDPCLFCRNAICKESREIIIGFTRELIAGIGDITKHLRPLGYVVSHKQSYLDEYKYAVHNIALDIRDGVRLTKVMEIILMKNGLLNQLRTPPISRLQKIHNVQVALNALKEANFVIAGDIAAVDIADGHREKTLSLLWQLIHVFRAPLFEKAANVIQTWWRKKYEVIAEKRREEERVRQKLNNAASTIQYWWRRIQYNRQVEWQMQTVTRATIVVQKYCRMWLCRTRLRKLKYSVLKIKEWYISIKTMRKAKDTLQKLRQERKKLQLKSAVVIQSHVRRWLCMRQYRSTVQKIVKVQSFIRKYLVRKNYLQLKKTAVFIARTYRGKLLMRREMNIFAKQKQSAIILQSRYKMLRQRRNYLHIKKSVLVLEERYHALLQMRKDRNKYLTLKRNIIKIQSLFRRHRCQKEYTKQKNTIIFLQRKLRSHLLMKKEQAHFTKVRNAAVVLQKYITSYLLMKKQKNIYQTQRKSAILIQQYYRAYLLGKSKRDSYVKLRQATVVLQRRYRDLISMRRDRTAFLELKKAAVIVQRQYRAQVEMRKYRQSFQKLKDSTLSVQRKYRALVLMRQERSRYLKLQSSCVLIQSRYRALIRGNTQRAKYLKLKEAAVKLQKWFRNCRTTKQVQQQYQETKQACTTIQTYYRAYIIGKTQRHEFIRIKTATITIQRFYRSYIETKMVRRQFIQIKTSTVIIQRFYRSYLETKKKRDAYLKMKSAVSCIEEYYKRYKEYQNIRQYYMKLRQVVMNVQRRYRSAVAMKLQRTEYLKLKDSVKNIQQRFRALLAMRKERQSYLTLRSAVLNIQRRYRAQYLMKRERRVFLIKYKACVTLQRFYRACAVAARKRQEFLTLKKSAIAVQRRYRANLAMRRERNSYLTKQKAAVCIQNRFRSYKLMLKHKHEYSSIVKACKIIQNAYRARSIGRKQREQYLKLKSSVVTIQTRYRTMIQTQTIRSNYLKLKTNVVYIQRRFRANKEAKKCRQEYLQIRRKVVTVQSIIRMYIIRQRFIKLRNATLTIQTYYRSYNLTLKQRQNYLQTRSLIIKIQSYVKSYIQRKRYLKLRASILIIQAVFRLSRHRAIVKRQRQAAAICIQKNYRRYVTQKKYRSYLKNIILVQQKWRGMLLMRLARCEFLQKKRTIIKIQSIARGYLVRKQIQIKKEEIVTIREENRRNWAASKIQVCKGTSLF